MANRLNQFTLRTFEGKKYPFRDYVFQFGWAVKNYKFYEVGYDTSFVFDSTGFDLKFVAFAELLMNFIRYKYETFLIVIYQLLLSYFLKLFFSNIIFKRNVFFLHRKCCTALLRLCLSTCFYSLKTHQLTFLVYILAAQL